MIKAGQLTQHVSGGSDLRGLYVTSSVANQLIAIDPGRRANSRTFSIARPYNLYFAPYDDREWCWWS